MFTGDTAITQPRQSAGRGKEDFSLGLEHIFKTVVLLKVWPPDHQPQNCRLPGPIESEIIVGGVVMLVIISEVTETQNRAREARRETLG